MDNRDRFAALAGGRILVLADGVAARSRGAPATSLLVALVLRECIVLGHVGDCRAYRLSHAVFQQLTFDHITWPSELDALGAEDAGAIRPLVRILDRALGGAVWEADVIIERLGAADGLLLCSNGVSEVISFAAMAGVLRGASDAGEACTRRLAAACRAGAANDATAVVLTLRHPAVAAL